SSGKVLAVNGLTPCEDEVNADLAASFHTRFSVSLITKDIPGSFCEFRFCCLTSRFAIPIIPYDARARTLMLGLAGSSPAEPRKTADLESTALPQSEIPRYARIDTVGKYTGRGYATDRRVCRGLPRSRPTPRG